MPKLKHPTSIKTPIGNRILVSAPPEQAEGKKDLLKVGELYMPEVGATGKVPIEAYYLATALAVGPDCETVKKGDTIIVPRQMLWGVTIDGVVIARFIRETEVNAVMK